MYEYRTYDRLHDYPIENKIKKHIGTVKNNNSGLEFWQCVFEKNYHIVDYLIHCLNLNLIFFPNKHIYDII